MKVVVTSHSFSSNLLLQKEIYKYFPNAKLNISGNRFDQNQLIEYIKDADAAIIGLETIDKKILEYCKNLKIIAKFGVGLNNIDLEECKKRNVIVAWTGGVNKLSVAEMALGFMLMLARNLYTTSNELKTGSWNKSGGFQLSKKNIGIIGLGNIGKQLVKLLKPFNCKIFVNDIINQDHYYKENNLEKTSKKKIFQTCDFVTIHTPYNGVTNNMVDIEVLKNMKRSAYILNTSRGGIVNEKDLKYALKNNLIAGAAIDTYIEEPAQDLEFLKLPNLICTPHVGGNAIEAVEAMGKSAINHLREHLLI